MERGNEIHNAAADQRQWLFFMPRHDAPLMLVGNKATQGKVEKSANGASVRQIEAATDTANLSRGCYVVASVIGALQSVRETLAPCRIISCALALCPREFQLMLLINTTIALEALSSHPGQPPVYLLG